MRTLKIKYRRITRSVVKSRFPGLADLVGREFTMVDISADTLSHSIMKD
jgi:hypothetical protein